MGNMVELTWPGKELERGRGVSILLPSIAKYV